MKDKLIALILRFSGANALWDKVDGYKSKIGAGGLMLAGAGLMLAGAAQVLAAYVGCIDHACQISLFQSLMSSESMKLMLEGLVVFKGGLLGLGLAHKAEKAAPSEPAA